MSLLNEEKLKTDLDFQYDNPLLYILRCYVFVKVLKFLFKNT